MKPSFSSPQEKALHSISWRLLGSQVLFTPDCYDGSKEPAGLAWIANRCAVLFYMTDSSKSFTYKNGHNLRQMSGWLRKWSSGTILRTTSDKGYHEFAFEDIDHIIGISVVDGAERSCCYNEIDHRHMSRHRLRVCITITSAVMSAIARVGAGPRDLLSVAGYLKKNNLRNISELSVIDFINATYAHEAAVIRSGLNIDLPDLGNLNESWRNSRHLFSAIRTSSDTDANVASTFADLTGIDIIWISTVEAAMINMMAPPGEEGPLFTRCVRYSDDYTIICSVLAHMKVVPPSTLIEPPTGPGLHIITSLDLGSDIPIRIIGVANSNETSVLAREIVAMSSG